MPSLLVSATLQSALLGAMSNILAQKITAIQDGKAFSLDISSLSFFVIFNLISCPPNVLWQIYLEDRFPANKVDPQGRKCLDKSNTMKKLWLDQTISAAANTIAYISAVSAYKGRDTAGIIEDVGRDFWPLLQSGWKLWPLVAILSFTVIPLQHRTLFGSVVSLVWNTYLSLLSTNR